MDITNCLLEIVLIVLFIYEAYKCFKNKSISPRMEEKYTKESVARFTKPYFVGLIIVIIYEIFILLCHANVINIGMDLDNSGMTGYFIKIAGLIPIIVITILGYAVILKKKDGYTGSGKKRNDQEDEDF